jgi:O-antigen ligase
MLITIPKLVTAVIILVMMGLAFSPLNFGVFYILFRPLVQPWAIKQYTLFAGVPLTAFFAIIVITYSTALCFVRRDFRILTPNSTLLYVLLLCSVISFTNTLNYFQSITHFLKLVTAVAFYNLIYNSIRNTSDAKRVTFALVLSSTLPMLIGYYQFFFEVGRRGLGGVANRVEGTLGMSNAYGIFLALCFCAGLILLLQKEGAKRRKTLIVILSSIIVSTIIALNRGTWIALSVALLFSYFSYRQFIKARWIVIPFVVISLVFSGMIIQRFFQLEETEHWQQTNTLKSRVEFWQDALRLVPDHPVAGFGLGTARIVTARFYRVDAVPHNDYVRLLLEIGLPGFLFYILFLLREFYRNVRLVFYPKNWAVNFPVLVCVTYWLIISSVQNIVYHQVNFLLFLALIAISRRWNELSGAERTGDL